MKRRPEQPWSRDEFVRRTYRGQLLFEPGTSWSYSNLGYLFLKEVLEFVLGRPFFAAVDEFLCRPLQLSQTRPVRTLTDWDDLVPASSSLISPDGAAHEVRGRYHPGWVAHGLLASTATDAARFLDALFRGNFLDAKSLRQLMDGVDVPGEHPPAVTLRYGLGLMLDVDSKEGGTLGQEGSGPDYSAQVQYWPKLGSGYVVAVLANREGVDMATITGSIARALLEAPER